GRARASAWGAANCSARAPQRLLRVLARERCRPARPAGSAARAPLSASAALLLIWSTDASSPRNAARAWNMIGTRNSNK
ncbi:unnamed protein product, partial [Amoebophrya sp. A120]